MLENNQIEKELFKVFNSPRLTTKIRVIAHHLLQIADEFDKINKEVEQQIKRKYTERNKR